ncbi:MAG: Yip1 family protein [Methylocystis sp.]
MTNDLVGRVQRLLLSPKAEWDAIDAEAVDRQKLITSYVAPLAAIPAIAGVIGMSVFGLHLPGAGAVKTPFGAALAAAVVTFAVQIGWVFVFAFIINALGPSFGAQKNYNQALKVAAYWPTASWVAGVFQILPVLGLIALAGAVYSLYLLFVGLPKLMKPETGKATTYTLASIGVAIVAAIVFSFALRGFMPGPDYARHSAASSSSASALQKRAEALEKAGDSGDFGAVLGALGAMGGGDPDAPVVDGEALRRLAPERVAGLARQSLEVETLSAPIKAVVMKASYGDGERTIDITVTNSPMVSAMMGLAGFAGAEFNRSTDDGYEKLSREGGSVVMEEWKNSSRRGRYGRSVGGTFLIEAEGDEVEMKALENAVKSFGERELAGLPKAR